MGVLVTPQDLARTYNPQSYEDAWETVEDYQRVLEYTGRHPQKGSSAVSSKLNLPRGRIHPWMNGSRPAPVRAIQIAETHDWLPLTDDGPIFMAFNRLVAWIFSRGSISTSEYSPLFVCPTEAEQERLRHLLATIDISYTLQREDSTDRATEAQLAEHRTIVGRILGELGAPLGPRENATSLPGYLDTVSETAVAAFADTYLENTARYWEFRDGYIVKQEDRTASYRTALAGLFARLVPSDADDIEVNRDSLFLPASTVATIQDQASRTLNQ